MKRIKEYIRKKIIQLNIILNKRLYYSIIDLVHPSLVPFNLEKFGRDSDGCYLLPVSEKFDYNEYAIFSFGIADDISFEENLSFKYPNTNIYCFDPFIEKFPESEFSNLKFHKKGIAGRTKKSKNLVTIKQICTDLKINRNKKVLLKMDIEGWEWDVFRKDIFFKIVNAEVIVIELHFSIFKNIWDALFFPIVFTNRYKILKKILSKYHIVYLHANNVSYTDLKNIRFPDLLELTLIKKDVILDYYLKNKQVVSSPPNSQTKPDYQIPFQY